MSEGRLRRWRPWQTDPHPAVLFGGYGLVVGAVLLLMSLGSALGVAAAVLLLCGVIATLVWWSGTPLPEPQVQTAPDRARVEPAPASAPSDTSVGSVHDEH